MTEHAASTVVQWFAVERPPGTREPKWKFTAAIADDGTVFAPRPLLQTKKPLCCVPAMMASLASWMRVISTSRPSGLPRNIPTWLMFFNPSNIDFQR
jgi:hypothetical protein